MHGDLAIVEAVGKVVTKHTMSWNNTIKAWVSRFGPLATLARSTYFALARRSFHSSSDYWQRRYLKGGTSGAGSYNRLARFKAEFLNAFVAQNNIATIVEFGCGDGAQLSMAEYPSYLGIDISPAAIEICRQRFAGDTTKRFELPGMEVGSRDLALSLDVIYHLVEDRVYEAYMTRLFAASHRYVIIYSSNVTAVVFEPHIRHRHFTAWIDLHQPGWVLRENMKNAYPFDPKDPFNTSFADFYVYERRPNYSSGPYGS